MCKFGGETQYKTNPHKLDSISWLATQSIWPPPESFPAIALRRMRMKMRKQTDAVNVAIRIAMVSGYEILGLFRAIVVPSAHYADVCSTCSDLKLNKTSFTCRPASARCSDRRSRFEACDIPRWTCGLQLGATFDLKPFSMEFIIPNITIRNIT